MTYNVFGGPLNPTLLNECCSTVHVASLMALAVVSLNCTVLFCFTPEIIEFSISRLSLFKRFFMPMVVCYCFVITVKSVFMLKCII